MQKKIYPLYINKLKILITYDKTFIIINTPNILMRNTCRDFRRPEEENEMKMLRITGHFGRSLRPARLWFFDSSSLINT
jgi:hypothetical protein